MEINIKELMIPIMIMFVTTLMSTAWKSAIYNIIHAIQRTFSVSVFIANQTWAYTKFMEILEDKKTSKNIRLIRISAGRWGDDPVITLSLGNGFHILRYNKRLMFISISEKQSTFYDEMLGMNIMVFGRDNSWVYDLKKELYAMKNKQINEPGFINILKLKDNIWSKAISTLERPMNTVFMNKNLKNNIIYIIQKFIDNEEWYRSRGINYQLGILLSGPPGTGKTSLIKALATHFNKIICLLRANELESIQEAIIDLPKDCFLVIEDIDSNKIVHHRKDDSNNKIIINNSSQIVKNKQKSEINLSDILNSIDGLMCRSGRILIATTNHPEHIDKALLRPGRIDHHCVMDYIDNDTFWEFIETFYEMNINIYKNKYILKSNNITIAELQNIYLQKNLSFDKFILEFTEEKGC